MLFYFALILSRRAYSIYLYYQSRFQIEFLFRDSKQFTGLADCYAKRYPLGQARDLSVEDAGVSPAYPTTLLTKLDFHFNASLAALNLAKFDAVQQHNCSTSLVFSMASYKRRALNGT